MKTYEERTQSVLNKITAKKKRRRAAAAAVAGCVCVSLLLALVLFMPYNNAPPSVSPYADSPYYGLIQLLNEATYQKPEYDNNYEWLQGEVFDSLNGAVAGGTDTVPEEAPGMMDGSDGMTYEEVTDNQVAGVIEGDIIKRSDRYIYYLRGGELSVYSIAGEASQKVADYTVSTENAIWNGEEEMYLSVDCTTVTVLYSCYRKDGDSSGTYICAVNLDVTDPAAIRESGRVYITGNYLSSRLVDGKLLLMGQYRVRSADIDFDDESSFLPQIGGSPDTLHSIPAEDIYYPEQINSTCYTVVTSLDGKTLEVDGSAAFLSYSEELYVSGGHIFATYGYRNREELAEGKTLTKAMTRVTCLSYADGLQCVGSVDVAGSVKDQYSMDEHAGIFRIVTSTSETVYEEGTDGELVWMSSGGVRENASLYCIDMATWQIAAAVENFAPAGETVRSARFDGDTAYVCTSLVLSDPVFFFDLSDLANITWKDTGTIEGYSSSLVNFGDGYLLGIGYDGEWNLKIEVYEETRDAVASVCVYEHGKYISHFSQNYKAYYIDRENQLIGLGVSYYDEDNALQQRYVLLLFDGYGLRELVNTELTGSNDLKRAFVSDGWLYMLGDEFKVEKVW